ncbi:MAG: DUF5687 family protein [Tannerella sp.]|jgi:hypothetical protein|nr:DUF5687 family protein [Tannerella sp.]
MIHKQLRQHRWKSFRRNPMFERNMAIRIFMYFMFVFIAFYLLAFGFLLETILSKSGQYESAVTSLNALIPYIFAADFIVKFFFKSNRSMQIAPYLTLPIKRNKLFDFLLLNEFSSFWNIYFIFLIVPFAFMAIPAEYGYLAAIVYIPVFYLMCVANSLLVSIVNNFISRNLLFYFLGAVIVACPFFLMFVCGIDPGDFTVWAGDMFLSFNPLVYAGFIVIFAVLWLINRLQMQERLYLELQGKKNEKISSFSSLSFLNRFGAIGDFINLELKMILRSPRLKQQILLAFILGIGMNFYVIYIPGNSFIEHGQFVFFLYLIFAIGGMGIIMGQYIFTSESSFFDGLASRNLSLFVLLKSKYFLYCSYSVLVFLLFLIPAFQGKISGFMLVSMLFFITGPVYCLIFQNAVFNKQHFDLFDKGMWNWKGQSGNMLVISMITMFMPVVFVLIIRAIFGNDAAYYFMLITGLAFTLTSKYWLAWTYNRFLRRRYKNMEGFRAN